MSKSAENSSETSNVNGDTQNEPERSAMNCNTPCAPDKGALSRFYYRTATYRTIPPHSGAQNPTRWLVQRTCNLHARRCRVQMLVSNKTHLGVNGYSSAVIAKMQRTDPDIGVILDWLDINASSGQEETWPSVIVQRPMNSKIMPRRMNSMVFVFISTTPRSWFVVWSSMILFNLRSLVILLLFSSWF